MKEISFNDFMIETILDGRKTMTRRLVKPIGFLKTKSRKYQKRIGKMGKYKSGECLRISGTNTLIRVIGIHKEILNKITREDALKEGVSPKWNTLAGCLGMYPNFFNKNRGFRDVDYDLGGIATNGAICSFRTLWHKLFGEGTFGTKKVWVIEFEKVED